MEPNQAQGKRKVILFVLVGLLVVSVTLGTIIPLGLYQIWRGPDLAKATGLIGGNICGDIKQPYGEIFKNAGAKFGVQPAFVAAIFVGEHQSVKETGYQDWPDANGPWATSNKGANGPFQFLLSTWDGHKQDGDGDGKTDVQNLADAAFGAAHMLSGNGAGGNTIEISKLQDSASRYNSGRPWNSKNSNGESGQDFAETRKYVTELVIPAFQHFYCAGGRVTSIAGTYDPTGGGNDGVPLFRQSDERYANNQVGGKNFSIWGCCPTSAAMVMRYYGAPMDPIKAAQITVDGGFYTGENGTDHGIPWLKALGQNFGFTKMEEIAVNGSGAGWDRVLKLLGDNKPLIARGDGNGETAPPYSANGHCIVLTSYDKSTNFININNPAPGLGDGPFPLEHMKKYTTVVYYFDK